MNKNEHLLSCLGEEGSEIAQDVSKCLRFGLNDRNVLNPTGPTNRERLVAELNDLLGVCRLLVIHGILPADWMNDRLQGEKVEKVMKFAEYARNVGALEHSDKRDWKPMSSAPKDGTLIIVALGDEPSYIYFVYWGKPTSRPLTFEENKIDGGMRWIVHHGHGNFITSQPCAWCSMPPVTNALLNARMAE